MKTSKVNLFTMMLNNFTMSGQMANLEISEIMVTCPKTSIYQKRLSNKKIALLYRVAPTKGVSVDTFQLISAKGVEVVKTTTLTKLTKSASGDYLRVVNKSFLDEFGNVVRSLIKQCFIK